MDGEYKSSTVKQEISKTNSKLKSLNATRQTQENCRIRAENSKLFNRMHLKSTSSYKSQQYEKQYQ